MASSQLSCSTATPVRDRHIAAGQAPKGTEIRAFLRRLIRANWPNTRILIRADSHYCCPGAPPSGVAEVIDFCRANGLDFILGVAPTTTLRRHIEELEASTKVRFEGAP